mmetsp:Transcript_27664/g.54015  ORF Transcript_27664/g.54015 Transcript_27664/m.54015 type:complete len:402 (+) Transcript_27664:1039-2244(+)
MRLAFPSLFSAALPPMLSASLLSLDSVSLLSLFSVSLLSLGSAACVASQPVARAVRGSPTEDCLRSLAGAVPAAFKDPPKSPRSPRRVLVALRRVDRPPPVDGRLNTWIGASGRTARAESERGPRGPTDSKGLHPSGTSLRVCSAEDSHCPSGRSHDTWSAVAVSSASSLRLVEVDCRKMEAKGEPPGELEDRRCVVVERLEAADSEAVKDPLRDLWLLALCQFAQLPKRLRTTSFRRLPSCRAMLKRISMSTSSGIVGRGGNSKPLPFRDDRQVMVKAAECLLQSKKLSSSSGDLVEARADTRDLLCRRASAPPMVGPAEDASARGSGRESGEDCVDVIESCSGIILVLPLDEAQCDRSVLAPCFCDPWFSCSCATLMSAAVRFTAAVEICQPERRACRV